MKNSKFVLALLIFGGTIFSQCSSSKNTTTSNDQEVIDEGYQQVLAKDSNQGNYGLNPNEERKSNVTLGDMIRRLPGVQVYGNGNNIRVKVSGSESFMASTDPLFVVNGNPVGSDYSQLVAVVNPNDVVSLNVLKGSDASIYGSRGANGVILIRTKK